MQPGRRFAPALCALLFLAPMAAASYEQEAPETAPGPSVAFDFTTLLAGGNAVPDSALTTGFGLHLTLRPGQVVLAASVEAATNFVSTLDAYLTVGAGRAWSGSDGWQTVALVVVGRHAFSTYDLFSDTQQDHDFRMLGVRVMSEHSLGRWIFPRAFVSASGYADLQREHDVNVGGQVGGFTVLISAGFGLGI